MHMKIFFDSVGCRLNQSEIEKMGAQFRTAGHEVVSSPELADYVIVNTCVVTAAAGADSRKAIRRAARRSQAKIIATGCYASIDPQTLKILPAVDQVIPNAKKDTIVDFVLGNSERKASRLNPRVPLPGERKRTRAFIKVQNGCDNHCTFCITRIARGPSKSERIDEIFQDIAAALAGGVKEVVLTGVNLGAWGRDFHTPQSLSNLISRIIQEFNPPRLRLSSLEPWDIDDQLINAFHLPGFCPHLHLPLQSGSDRILKSMGRKIDTTSYRMLVDKIREKIPHIAITTDLMVGFPGENDQKFQESLKFVEEMDFAGGHVFRYSARPGTPAELMPNEVHPSSLKERSGMMRKTISITRKKYQKQFLGETLNVLWQNARRSNGSWAVYGLSDNYINVRAQSPVQLENQISKVFIHAYRDQFLEGEIIESK